MGKLGMANSSVENTVRKTTLREANDDLRDVSYWLSKTPDERLAALETLRQPVIEALPAAQQRLQRVYRVTTLKRG
jgi:hypothetical protein